MFSTMSLKIRVLSITVLFTGIGLLGTAFLLTHIFNQYLEAQVKQELLIHLNQLSASLVIDDSGELSLDKPLSDPRFNTPYSGLYWQIHQLPSADPETLSKNSSWQLPLLRSRSLWEEAIQPSSITLLAQDTFYQVIEGPPDEQLMILGRVVELEESTTTPFLLLVGIDQSVPLYSFMVFKRILLGAFLSLAIGMIFIAWLQIYLSLNPLNRMARDLNQITQGKARRLQGEYPKEIQPLVNAFHDVLDHDTDVLTRARTQAGNLAHSLKTPLSILSQAAQNFDETTLVSTSDPQEKTAHPHLNKSLPDLIVQQVKQIKQFIDYHLAQTRAAASAKIPGQRTDLFEVLNPLVRTLKILYQEKHLVFRIDDLTEGNAFFQGEQQDLYEILGNLLDNACKWAKKNIEIKIQVISQELILCIEDDGPGLNISSREQVFERGVRMDEHTAGSGIGLFIVKDLCQLYQGDLRLGVSPQGGLRVEILLPAAKS